MHHDVARPPGHWFRRILLFAGICLAALAATPRHAAAQCSNTLLILSPCGGTATINPGSTNQQYTFSFTNLLAIQQQVSVGVSCAGYVVSCSTNVSFVHMAAHGSGNVIVTYGVAGAGGTGSFTLTGGTLSSTITVQSPQHNAPVVSLPYYNNDNVQPALCASNCFDKVLTYSTPPYFTMGQPRGVTLMYRSNTANPMVTVQVDGYDPSVVHPTKMSLKVQRPGGALVTFTNGTTELFFTYSNAINPNRVTGQFAPQGADTLTGAYNYTAIVTSYFADNTVLSASTPLRILLENERSSVFGAGWTVAGQQTLYPQSNGDVVITDGMGAISYFTLKNPPCTQGCSFQSPTGDYTTLTTKAQDQFGRHYDRRYPDGTTYEFLGSGPLAGIYDKNGSQTVFWYDHKGRDSLISDPLGTSFSYGMHFVYGDSANVSDGWKTGAIRIITDPYGRSTWFGVDNNNDERGIEDPMGGQYAPAIPFFIAVSPTYNAQHQMISNIDRHAAAWHFGYDFAGKLLADTAPAVLADGVTQPPVTNYQSAERTFLINPSSGQGTSANPAGFEGGGPWWVAVTNPEGHATNFTIDRWGQPLTVNDAGGGTTLYSRGGDYYHAGGIPPLTITYPWGGVDSARYNANGLLAWSRPARQDSTRYAYGNNFAIADTVTGPNRPSQVLTLNASGDVTKSTVAAKYTTNYYPDSKGRDTLVVDPLGHSFSYHYESGHGNLDSTLSPGNRFTKRVFDLYGRDSVDWVNAQPKSTTLYDALNRPTQVSGGAMSDTTRFFYDSVFLTSVRDAKGQVYGSVVNALGWPTRRYGPADASGQGILYLYDKNGQPTTITNRRGQAVTYSYDAMERVHTKGGTGVDSVTYTYSADQRTVVGATALVTDTMLVDATGWQNAESQTFTVGSAHDNFHVKYYPTTRQQLDSIDVSSSASGITFAGRKYIWDNTTGLLSAVDVNNREAAAFGYDNEAKLTHIHWPNLVEDSIAYTTFHQVYQTAYYGDFTGGGTLIDTALVRQYDYDSLGRVFLEIRQLPNGNLNLAYPQYDSLGHARGFYSFANTPSCPSFDPASGYGCAPANSSLYVPEARGFDALGNELIDSVYSYTNFVPTITTATYGAGSRIQTKGALSYSTDADGNVTRKYGGSRDTRFAWSPDGLMIGDTVHATGQVLHYDYDAFGRLVRRTRNGTIERYFLWSGKQLLAELDGTLTHRIAEYAYLPGIDDPLALITGAQAVTAVKYFAQDAEGNVIGVTDSNGVVRQTLGYTTQGMPDSLATTFGALADTNRLRWKGLMWEGDSTRLYYIRARWYDPEQGRFMSEDPIGIAGGINPYVFADDDYINSSDPSGLDSEDDYCKTHPGQYNPDSNKWCPTIITAKPNPPPPPFPPADTGPGQGDQNGSASGGGGSGGNSIAAKICSAIPSGRTMGASAGIGGIGSVGGGGEVVFNYNSGQVSAFAFGGVQVGWNGGVSGSVYTGFVYGLNGSNSNYSGGFTGVTGGAGLGGFVESSSGGLTGSVAGIVPNRAVTVVGVSMGGGLLSGFSGGLAVTNYTNPLQMGKFNGFTLLDMAAYVARQACN